MNFTDGFRHLLRTTSGLPFLFLCACHLVSSKAPDLEAETGSIAGTILLEGAIPRSWVAANGKGTGLGSVVEAPEAWDGIPPREIEVTPEGWIAGVAVWLEPLASRSDASARSGHHTRLSMKKDPIPQFQLEGSCFWPSVLTVPVGSMLTLNNVDARLHRVTSVDGNLPVDLTVPPGDQVTLRVDQVGHTRLTCNDHAFMRANLVVTQSSHSDVTDKNGQFEIANIPRGRYRLHFAHHRLASPEADFFVKVESGEILFINLSATRGSWN